MGGGTVALSPPFDGRLTAEAYAALPALREASRASFVDILHNAAPEGSLGASIARDRWLDLHFAVGEAQAEATPTPRSGTPPASLRAP